MSEGYSKVVSIKPKGLVNDKMTERGKSMAKALTPTIKGTSVELGWDVEAREALRTFKEALQAKKDADEAKAKAEAVLRAKLGNAELATMGGEVVFKIMAVAKKDPDRQMLKDQYPAVFEAIMKDASYDYIKALS